MEIVAHALERQRRTNRTITVAELMNRDYPCVTPDLGVQSLIYLLTEHDILEAPVVATDGRLLGSVSLTDAFRCSDELSPGVSPRWLRERFGPGFHEEIGSPLVVADIMKSSVPTSRSHVSLVQVVRRMAHDGLSWLPIVDLRDRVVGVITAVRVLQHLAR